VKGGKMSHCEVTYLILLALSFALVWRERRRRRAEHEAHVMRLIAEMHASFRGEQE
jgi:hypothetical protein